MNKAELMLLLGNLRSSEGSGKNVLNNHTEYFEKEFQKVSAELNCSYHDIAGHLKNIVKHYFSDPNIAEWKYLLSRIYVLTKIGELVRNSDGTELLLSVRDIKSVKSCICDVTKIGIYTKLLPKLPFFVDETYTDTDDIFFQYNVLKCTVTALCDFLKNDHLRSVVLAESLRAVLVALYQIAFCPLKKTALTEDTFDRLALEKQTAVITLKRLRDTIHPRIHAKETMIVMRRSSPPWFKRAVSQTLTDALRSPDGVENIAAAMLDGTGSDTSQTWRAFDVIYRLLMPSCQTAPDFGDDICKQLVRLADKGDDDRRRVFERLFAFCARKFHAERAEEVFVAKVVADLLRFTYEGRAFDGGDLTRQIRKTVGLAHAVFVEHRADCPPVPMDVLKPVLYVIFRFYCIASIGDASQSATTSESKDILLTYLQNRPEEDQTVFDAFLFQIHETLQILPFNKGAILTDPNISATQTVWESSEKLAILMENQAELLTRFFVYLLRCLVDENKYFSNKVGMGGTLSADDSVERKLAVHRLLSRLIENKEVQRQIVDSPEEILGFIRNVLAKTVDANVHKTDAFETDQFQTFFTVIVVLNCLIGENRAKSIEQFKVLAVPLETVKNETSHAELRGLIADILCRIENGTEQVQTKGTRTNLDKVLEDICDPLLPVRGHGLMELKKLVEQREGSVMGKKQYVLTIFQQNLKNDDSFIYLTAIDGLATMAEVFPNVVLNALCDEYSEFSRSNDDGHEVRIKVGEVLVRVVKMLGEMAPKYRSLLLNTFLNGAKDDDHLVRASSLSNLGEICGVLGYKLGTVVTEVLACVHAVVSTDRAPEARRAAVTVLRQLLTGLEGQTVAFLKEDILPVYRTLKRLYRTDKDDVTRLQAQLALEELNENMNNFLFPKPQLNADNKVILLN